MRTPSTTVRTPSVVTRLVFSRSHPMRGRAEHVLHTIDCPEDTPVTEVAELMIKRLDTKIGSHMRNNPPNKVRDNY